MNSIDQAKESELLIKKSRFISIIEPFENEENLNNIINKYMHKYKNANHYTYAYKTLTKTKYSDDNEPSMTAGLPIFEEIEQNELTNVICIVIRYFGGIKLGTGGLRRAYKEAAHDVITKVKIKKLISSQIIEITFNYNDTANVKQIIKDVEVIAESYEKEVYMKLNLPNDFDIKKLENYTTSINAKEKAFILK